MKMETGVNPIEIQLKKKKSLAPKVLKEIE